MSIVVNKTRLPVTNWQTKSGAVVSIDDARQRLARSLKVHMLSQQDLHGYDNPWPAGGGKNLLDPSKRTVYSDGKGQRWNESDGFTLKANQAYTFSVTYGNPIALYIRSKLDGTNLATGNQSITYTPSEDTIVYFQAYRGENISLVDTFQLELGSTATLYAPYSNICPISGRSEVNVYVEETYDQQATPKATIQLGQTVYGVTMDLVSGVMVVDEAKIVFTDGSAVWTKSNSYSGGFFCQWTYISQKYGVLFANSTPFICSHAKTATRLQDYLVGTCYSDSSCNIRIMPSDATLTEWKDYLLNQYNNGTPVEICGKLATPLTFHLTPQQIQMLMRDNTIWSDADSVEVEYAAVHQH